MFDIEYIQKVLEETLSKYIHDKQIMSYAMHPQIPTENTAPTLYTSVCTNTCSGMLAVFRVSKHNYFIQLTNKVDAIASITLIGGNEFIYDVNTVDKTLRKLYKQLHR